VSTGALAWTRGRALAGLAAGPASRLPVRRRQRRIDVAAWKTSNAVTQVALRCLPSAELDQVIRGPIVAKTLLLPLSRVSRRIAMPRIGVCGRS
jgi:hypothetical protein